ncbi:MAG: agmatinase [bacterium]
MFLAARSPADASAAAAAILGAPYDRTSSFRRGARFGPAAIRWASHSIESYSPLLERDLEDLVLVDRGDLEIESLPPEAMAAAVEAAVAGIFAGGGLPVLFGGDHAVTPGAVRAAVAAHPDLRVLILDAHLDLRQEYDGSRWSHATVTRRILEQLTPDRVAMLGVRSGTAEEFGAAAHLLAAEPLLRLTPQVWSALEGTPLYLSVDLDVVDPSAAPGVGNPEPAGPSAADLLGLLRGLAPLRVVGMDLVEVAPPYDPSGRTAVLAATIIRDALLTWVR